MSNSMKMLSGIVFGALIMFIFMFNTGYRSTDTYQISDSLKNKNIIIMQLADSISTIGHINDSLEKLYVSRDTYMDSIEKELRYYDSVIAKINSRDENYFNDTLSVRERVVFFEQYYRYYK